ncbi:hypothetical protein ABZ791_26780 [Streptomyces huasconensis]|uniref:Uncharacterized protein n=1 Tax=Streptomyces huasconensis TaxID=1854574 RepID=A0ABV3LWI9_9ACTN
MLTSAQAPRTDKAPGMSLLLTTTVPRGYAHRASVAEMLITGWDKDAHTLAETSDAYVVRARCVPGVGQQGAGLADRLDQEQRVPVAVGRREERGTQEGERVFTADLVLRRPAG